MTGTTTIDVVRGGTTVLTGITAQIDPVDPKPYEVAQLPDDAAGTTIFDRYEIFPLNPSLPDIRARDQLVDTQDTDPMTPGSNSTYYVRRVKTYTGSHLEIEAERVATRPTT